MTKTRKYEADILQQLLTKYYKRMLRYGHTKSRRRIDLKITKVYPDYEKLNADIEVKGQVNEAVHKLEALGYLSAERLPYSDDIKKLCLNEGTIEKIENWLEAEFGILARNNKLKCGAAVLKPFAGKGELTDFYCSKLKYDMEHSVQDIDLERARDLLEMLAFIQDNERELYVREASMLVYGSSKYFESDRRYEEICTIIRSALGREKAENEQNDDILQQYHISNVEQEICLKGDFFIEMGDYCLETKYFSGGISLSSRDIGKIGRITVRTENIITIENKTSYYRFAGENFSGIYLGGYANRHQIEFLRKVCRDNENCRLWHFGDIDVGGFLIHQHLCMAVEADFRLFHMGVEELRDERYRNSLVMLTENDIARAKKLADNPVYCKVIKEMLERQIKLEQEIVAYTLMASP